jgi:hypothetical protein
MAKKHTTSTGRIKFDCLGGCFVTYDPDTRSYWCSSGECIGKNGATEKQAENHADFCMVIPSHLAYNTDAKKWWQR